MGSSQSNTIVNDDNGDESFEIVNFEEPSSVVEEYNNETVKIYDNIVPETLNFHVESDSDDCTRNFKHHNRHKREQKIFRKRNKYMMTHTLDKKLYEIIYHRTVNSYYDPIMFNKYFCY